MATLPIYTYGTPVLRQKAKPVDRLSNQLVKLIIDMFETMHSAQGIGLAATQIGSLHRVLVIDVSGVEGMEDAKPLTIINPEVLSQAGAWSMEEGCLSIPDVRDEIERPESICLRYKDTNFRDVEVEFDGLLARVILHEIDHLDGILFIDRLPADRKKLHTDALKQIQRGEMEVQYSVVTSADVPVSG